MTCFITSLVGFDISYLEPSLVAEIFSDTLTGLTLACNLVPYTTLPPIPNPIHLSLPLVLPLYPLPPPSQTEPSVPPPAVPIPLQVTPGDPQSQYPLNFSRASLATKQHQDKWLGPLYRYLVSGCDVTELTDLSKSDQTWVKSTATRSKIVDDLIMYSDVLMDDPNHLCIFVPSDIELQCHLLRASHDSPVGMHHGRDATYNSLSHDFYWRHMHKHVRSWVRRCPQCISFKSLQPSHGPMQLRLYQYPFHTLVVDYVGELPPSPPQVIGGFSLPYAPTQIISVRSQFLTKLQPLQLMPYFIMFFSSSVFPLCSRVIVVVNF